VSSLLCTLQKLNTATNRLIAALWLFPAQLLRNQRHQLGDLDAVPLYRLTVAESKESGGEISADKAGN
jgi:hypothetical protein